jgi:hypothetical protein
MGATSSHCSRSEDYPRATRLDYANLDFGNLAVFITVRTICQWQANQPQNMERGVLPVSKESLS